MHIEPKYTHVIFDLDHTVWDFETNPRETVMQLYDSFGLQRHLRGSADDFVETFGAINKQMWKQYNQKKISKEDLRVKRGNLVFSKLGYSNPSLALELDQEYISICPTKGKLMPGAKEVLAYLTKKYQIHILTNAFAETQMKKLEHAGILPFFGEVVTSEDTGYTKPNNTIFYHLLRKLGSRNKDCIMIGDNYMTDILGAKKLNMDHILFNPEKVSHSFKVQHEIDHLDQLMSLL